MTQIFFLISDCSQELWLSRSLDSYTWGCPLLKNSGLQNKADGVRSIQFLKAFGSLDPLLNTECLFYRLWCIYCWNHHSSVSVESLWYLHVLCSDCCRCCVWEMIWRRQWFEQAHQLTDDCWLYSSPNQTRQKTRSAPQTSEASASVRAGTVVRNKLLLPAGHAADARGQNGTQWGIVCPAVSQRPTRLYRTAIRAVPHLQKPSYLLRQMLFFHSHLMELP